MINSKNFKFKNRFKRLLVFIKKTYIAWDSNDPFVKSAVIAYYTLFSLPSLLMIVTWIASIFVDREAINGGIENQISGYVGPDSAEAVQSMVTNAALTGGNWIAFLVGAGALIYGATGVFFQMKKAMNDIWTVREKKQNFKTMLKNRALSFGMVLMLAFLLLVSLLLSWALHILSTYIGHFAPEFAAVLADIFQFLLSFVVISGLFAAIFKILPDVKMTYKTTFLGAGITAVLFILGEYLLGYYFAKGNPASVYGGAASIVLILLWVNYTCLILFFGAEITKQYALRNKHKIVPTHNAELAYVQEMRELKEREEKAHADKEKAEELESNPEDGEEPKRLTE